MKLSGIVISGTNSSSGKTTIATGITACLKKRGYNVQPYKCGPDYIDPGWLTTAAGLPCYNLDSWMLTPRQMAELFAHSSQNKDISVIEGVMGLYDGKDDTVSGGSTASIAKTLKMPVILVINVSGMAQSAAAITLGYKEMDTAVNVKGVILNKVGSPQHYVIAAEAITAKTGLPVLGYLPKKASLKLPERHLGLLPSVERDNKPELIDELCQQIEETLDLEGLIKIAKDAGETKLEGNIFPPKPLFDVTIAVARDEAFNFYYQHNLEIMEAYGAKLKYFSPLKDKNMPAGVGGIYIGGGFPEIFAKELAENFAMKKALQKAVSEGVPLYAECGGLMYLCQGIRDFDGKVFDMTGIIPGVSAMGKKLQRLGYFAVRATNDSILAQTGWELRGHAFHWSQLPPPPPQDAAYNILEGGEGDEGFIAGPNRNVLASYLHLHFGGNATAVRRFLKKCEE